MKWSKLNVLFEPLRLLTKNITKENEISSYCSKYQMNSFDEMKKNRSIYKDKIENEKKLIFIILK